MAMASPTPMGPHHLGPRRYPSRQTLRQAPSRPQIARHNAGVSAIPVPRAANDRNFNLGDSSDDDIAPPIFNKATNRLLEGEQSILDPSSPPVSDEPLKRNRVSPETRRGHWDGSAGLYNDRSREATKSPEFRDLSPYPRRVVRLSGTPRSMRRTSSLQESGQHYEVQNVVDSPITTPAVKRTVRLPITSSFKRTGASGGSSNKNSGSRIGSGQRSGESDQEAVEDQATVARMQAAISHGSVTRFGTSGRNRYGDDTGVPQSTMRIKRVGPLAGNFLKGPARRGRRRQSEEDQENEDPSEPNFQSQEPESQLPESQEWVSSQEPEVGRSTSYAAKASEFASGSPIDGHEAAKPDSPIHTLSLHKPLKIYGQEEKERAPSSTGLSAQPVFRVPPPHPQMPSSHDQENEAPPTFRRDKPVPFALMDKVDKVSAKVQVRETRVHRVEVSPERKPLTTRSQNTPRRPAPPPPAPPKMSVLETATASAGAAASSHANKKRNAIRINGKIFTRLDVIGRGGSSKVYRVMADNGKFLALKRVLLEDADEGAVRGFKGEIDLLRKLQNNERVVRLLDYEMNDEKQTLSVLMEMGELDFNKILTVRFNSDSPIFDPSFTRHYWKEMLECIKAVHDEDIVHSDLKPANFVLVQGRLKLIDFGIANAIETDETVNVHRDTQVGTPNYMSPESLIESQDLPGNQSSGHQNGPRLWKLGKPSDIWSLGCILYQMSYGRQPFAHIANQMSRCRAIIDFNYAIEYPSTGVGGVSLPKSLIRTMKRCLNRDQHQRPTAEQLLDFKDTFLYPVEYDPESIEMTEELLGRILQSVAGKCKDRTPTEAELLKVWPAGYFASLRKSA